MREASAYAPGHLTGFFQICDEPEDPLLKGSRGCGTSINEGVITRVRVEPADHWCFSIQINGEKREDAIVSKNVLEKMMSKADQPHRVIIEHEVDVPLGAGFGSSGAGALTLALASNEAMGIGLTEIDASRVAHVAEIECKTGLGTVFAAMEGGFGVLYEPGAPGIGRALKYEGSDELAVVYVHFGPIATRKALSDSSLRKKINMLGGKLVDEIRQDLFPEKFMGYARRFTDFVGIATPRIRRVLKDADTKGVPCTMAMFGEVAFALVDKKEAYEVSSVFSEAAKGFNVKTVFVEDRGAHLIKSK
jgi:pantoate kinase